MAGSCFCRQGGLSPETRAHREHYAALQVHFISRLHFLSPRCQSFMHLSRYTLYHWDWYPLYLPDASPLCISPGILYMPALICTKTSCSFTGTLNHQTHVLTKTFHKHLQLHFICLYTRALCFPKGTLKVPAHRKQASCMHLYGCNSYEPFFSIGFGWKQYLVLSILFFLHSHPVICINLS